MLNSHDEGKGPSLGFFDGKDPFRIVDQLSEEERIALSK